MRNILSHFGKIWKAKDVQAPFPRAPMLIISPLVI